MTFRNRAADARLRSIERALQNAGNRLNAIIRREDAGDKTADAMPIHREIRRLIEEAADLHPVSNAGLAAKARIVARYYELAAEGRAVLGSLVEDLITKAQPPLR